MDSFELNKIVGAVLGTCLVLLVSNMTAKAIFRAEPAPDSTVVAAKSAEPTGAPQGTPAPSEPIEKLLQTASIDKGATAAKKCATCHAFEKGGPNRTGPNLFGVVDRARAAVPGFNYSAAMKAAGGSWGIEELNAFIASPKGTVPGTAMSFAGIPKDGERADLIAYLRSLSDQAAPQPGPPPTASN
ncbi:cytochrome c family protein [Rhodopseudomonas pseudopalustris]|uniref:c-type cytochrome n=1 Tax=Rhodopseudomonas pseudopalustris TaxID=1513892 RepID=UPI003F946D80